MRVVSLSVLLLGLLSAAGCVGSGDESDDAAARANEPRSLLQMEKDQAASLLKANQTRYEFGAVPIDGGNVQTTFEVSNEGPDPVRLAAVYTSCGCTSAVLEFADGAKEGPFGMPGHDVQTELDRTISGGEKFLVTVIFNPAAHGPEGVGSVMRTVTLHTQDGSGIELAITANVVKA